MIPLLLTLTAAVLVTLLELRWPGRREKPQRLINLVVWAAGFALAILLLPTVSLGVTGLAHRFGVASLGVAAWPLWLGLPVFFLAMDFGEYAFHRAQHAIPWLWKMHSLHHSDPCMSATTTQRHWVGDQFLKAVTIWPAVILALGPSPVMTTAWVVVAIYHFFVHANLKVNYGRFSVLLNNPAYHRIHHARAPEHYDTNFASLFPTTT
ncbi:MAG TPA: sterol desaturase family protein [Caulobacteraceae bacterium]|nr:sterol desaturase family protein [Caulobacteraceae bacterium]